MFNNITTTSADGFFRAALAYFEILSINVASYFQNPGNLRNLSIGLIYFAAFLFFLMLITLVIKAVFLSRRDAPSKPADKTMQEGMFLFFDDEEGRDEQERSEEMEIAEERQRISAEKDDAALGQNKNFDDEEQNLTKQKNKKELAVDFDWKKGKSEKQEALSLDLQVGALEYQQGRKEVRELIGLVIDMLARGVDNLKIAQTIMFRTQGKASEDDVLQTIDTVKEFIRLCNNRLFAVIKNNPNLPQEDEALIKWAEGDASQVMIMLQALIDEKVDRSALAGIGAQRDALFNEASSLAFNFGVIASMEDSKLAANALELAIEFNPKNVWAWNKVADIYYKTGDIKKAKWAYETSLEIADDNANIQQIANASRGLSRIYKNEKAESLYKVGKDYYDLIGINRRLDKKEIEIVQLIESKQKAEIANIVGRVLEI